jgi:hypothetical protein
MALAEVVYSIAIELNKVSKIQAGEWRQTAQKALKTGTKER